MIILARVVVTPLKSLAITFKLSLSTYYPGQKKNHAADA